MKQRVLITGASGFVGYHLIEEALKNDLEVYAAVRKSSQIDHLKNLDIKFTYPDYRNELALQQEIELNKYDYIIHAAGVTSARNANEYNVINAGYTRNLAKAAEAAGVKKFVLISSLAAVGPLKTLNGIITEETPPKPVTAYGKSKLLAEKQVKATAALDYTILRPTAVYGPRDKDIFIALKQFAKGFEPHIGKFEQKLSFIYVKDLAKASVRALYKGSRKTYNIADGNFYDRYELAQSTKNVLGIKTIKVHLPVNFVKLIAGLAEIIGYLRHKAPALNREKLNELAAVNWFCSIDQAKYDLGFYPEYDLKAGIKASITWYKANQWL